MKLFPASLNRGFLAMALDDQIFMAPAPKLQEGLGQLLHGAEDLHPERFSLRMRARRPAQPLPSGGRTKAGYADPLRHLPGWDPNRCPQEL